MILLLVGVPASATPHGVALDPAVLAVDAARTGSTAAFSCGGTSPLVNNCHFSQLIEPSMSVDFYVAEGIPYTGTLDAYISTSTGTYRLTCTVLSSIESACGATQAGSLFVGQRATVNVYSTGYGGAPAPVGDWRLNFS